MTFAFAAPMAYNAVAPFKKKHDKLTYLGVLFPGYLQIVTKKSSNINKFEDLFDKRISAGKIGWGGELMFRLMLGVYGMDYNKIRAKGGVINHVGTAQSTQMMRDGNMDAIVSGGSPPSHPKFAELSLTTKIDLLSVGDAGLGRIFKAYPSFVKATMPADPYKGVKGGFRTIGGNGYPGRAEKPVQRGRLPDRQGVLRQPGRHQEGHEAVARGPGQGRPDRQQGPAPASRRRPLLQGNGHELTPGN